MTPNGRHDPVNAISEAAATGAVTETFTDIRAVMGIPLITSIWRTLVAVEGGLEAAWQATLWRHLAPWPGLLEVIRDGLDPRQRDGAIGQVMEIAAVEGARLAHHRPKPLKLPPEVRTMIAKYVTNPGLVARMVTLGHGLAGWLGSA